MENLTNRQKQALETRRKIFNVAIRLFEKHSFEKVTIKDICKACNLSVGGFYHHFKTKNDILDEGYRQFDMKTKNNFEKHHLASPIASLLFLIEEQTNSVEHLGYKAFSQYLNNQLNVENKFIFNHDRFFTNKVIECVQSAINNETLNGDTSVISEEILSMTRGLIYDWCLHCGSYSLQERSLKLTKMILQAYENK